MDKSSTIETVAELSSKSQADALTSYLTIVGQRASCLKKKFIKLLIVEQEQNQVTSLQMRVVVLKKLAARPFIYTLKAGQRKGETVRMDLTNCAVSQADVNDMIEVIVDIVSAVWETCGLINRAYDTVSPPAPGNRGRLRSQERELWVTAAISFRQEQNAAYAHNSVSNSHHASLATCGSLSESYRQIATDQHHKGTPQPTATQSKYQKQYQAYMRAFKSISQKLQHETFLINDFTCNKRTVTDDPILIEAQSKSGRHNISSNRNPCVTGKYVQHHFSSFFKIDLPVLFSDWVSTNQSRRVHYTSKS